VSRRVTNPDPWLCLLSPVVHKLGGPARDDLDEVGR
jgi:hypothetical protein